MKGHNVSERARICLVHYHEIGLKGRNRADFENRLVRNLQSLLAHHPIAGIKRISGRILAMLEPGIDFAAACKVEDAIAGVPGVARVSCGFACERDLDDMNEAARNALEDLGPFSSFKVAARRSHTDFEIDSMQLNQLVGAYLCAQFPDKDVKMKDPDATVHVEVVQGSAYVYAKTVKGIGGLPVGSGGRVVCLLSSGIDSPVATWRMARRGAVCIAVHFSGRPQAEPTSEYLVADIASVLEKTGCIARVYTAPIGDYQREIAAQAPPALRVILYRRLMLRVAEEIAEREGARALVTGESLGQVASQTLDNIAATDDAVSIPVLRPLIGTDKQEIVDQALELGTFEISSQDAQDCCTLFMPRNPETHAKLDRVRAAEEQFDVAAWACRIADEASVVDYRCPSYKPRKPRTEN